MGNYESDKICTICGRQKNKKNHFYKEARVKDGYRSVCKTCENANNIKIKSNGNIFFSEEIIAMSKIHRTTKVKYFGYFTGLLVYIRNAEILAFSVLVGSEIFKTATEGKAWLCQQVVKAGDQIKKGLLTNL